MSINLPENCMHCGASGHINIVTHIFNLPCECHSTYHTITSNLCDKCYAQYQDHPEELYKDTMIYTDISVGTFCILLQAYAKLYQNYPDIHFDMHTVSPEYRIINHTPIIQIKCTYKMLEFLGELYTEWIEYMDAISDSSVE